MRRFINSLPGRVVCQIVATALMLPFLTFAIARKATAQIQQLPRWAVVDFVNQSKKGGKEVGSAAAEAVYNELAKNTTKYDLESPESVKRVIDQLGLTTPVTDKTSLLRLAQALSVGTLVTGEVADWQVRSVGGGKQADVAVRVLVVDVASGLPVNGALVNEHSSVRAGDPSNETLLNEALAQASASAVAKIQSQTLPSATVLNTNVGVALINQGTRVGFQVGQEVIISRGREQVATAKVSDVEPDQADIKITRSFKGVQPGDKVRVVVDPGTFGTAKLSENRSNVPVAPNRAARKSSSSSLVTLALVLGLVFILLSNGRSGNNVGVGSLTAEPTLYPSNAGSPAVLLRWTLDLFHRGLDNRVQWQIWRSDILTTPVLVADRNVTTAVDTDVARATLDYDTGLLGGTTCQDVGTANTTNVPGVTPGRPYAYQISLIYRISPNDIPGGNSTGTNNTGSTNTGSTNTGSNNTGSNNTGSNNTGSNNTGSNNTGTNGSTFCYFTTDKTAARGVATPLSRVELVSPQPDATVINFIPFSFKSAVNPAFPTLIGYRLQISANPNFPAAGVFTSDELVSGSVASVSINITPRFTGDTFAKFLDDKFPGSQILYWRVGARSLNDDPGPAKDQTGYGYIWSAKQIFKRPAPPPGKPHLARK